MFKRYNLFLALTIIAQPVVAQNEAADAEPDASEAFLPASIGKEEQAIVAGLNQFGAELYTKLRDEPGSLIVSPASVSTAFGLAYAGAKGTTADEIAATLHYPALANFHGAFGSLLDTMQLNRLGRTLSVNNAIWLQTGLPVRSEYRTLVELSYRAGLQRVDYTADPLAALEKINGWVEAKTNNRIRNLLSPLEVNKDTKSVLVNTVYFKADWASPFDARATKIEDFIPLSRKAVKQPFMHQRGHFGFAERDGAKALILPYRGGETEMVVLLPPSNATLAAFEAKLTMPALDEWISQATHHDTIVTLPKFKIEKRYRLKPTLQELGMKMPFANESDFSGLARPIKIGSVIHQVFVEVEEKGTEAAAATAIVMDVIVTGTRSRPPPPKIFRADRAFVFVIRDRRTKVILFFGRYSGPDTTE